MLRSFVMKSAIAAESPLLFFSDDYGRRVASCNAENTQDTDNEEW
jgi:hypothetical protein